MSTVKTAISLEKSLFEEMNELARQMKVSRSRVFSLAAQEFIRRQQNSTLLEQINAAYDDLSDEDYDLPSTDVVRRLMRTNIEDEW
jgi:metal-responsive CopG/Arc/MetJ family transcriptional regulator